MAAKKISENPSKQRNEHNRDLIRRMRNGESLTSFDSKASWYPPRPIIEKDLQALARVYGDDGQHPGEMNAAETTNHTARTTKKLMIRLVQ